ncbi:hypothetical protein EJB05_48344 [Eragrostis curvula]|uniref:Uncharacterized protein n=1 Tax=Eragrostis curvula TaxID=38414 RepID=A0A5J9T1N6_9POAL|nr:hypothetical protein EJB05_48344 [Eragrostis curvula]
MSEGCFWTINFVLLHHRIKREDPEILSTQQVHDVPKEEMCGWRTMEEIFCNSQESEPSIVRTNVDLYYASRKYCAYGGVSITETLSERMYPHTYSTILIQQQDTPEMIADAAAAADLSWAEAAWLRHTAETPDY